LDDYLIQFETSSIERLYQSGPGTQFRTVDVEHKGEGA
jgi:hypothetical protein